MQKIAGLLMVVSLLLFPLISFGQSAREPEEINKTSALSEEENKSKKVTEDIENLKEEINQLKAENINLKDQIKKIILLLDEENKSKKARGDVERLKGEINQLKAKIKKKKDQEGPEKNINSATISETDRDGRFIAYNNGTVLDTRTYLMWASEDNGSDINWKDAKRYCETYRGGGYTDWRMPTQNELAGLYDVSKNNQTTQSSFYVHLTKLIQLSSCCPWASETRGSDAAAFFFTLGSRNWFPQSLGNNYRALPVRSGR
jgi:hypothetical protein